MLIPMFEVSRTSRFCYFLPQYFANTCLIHYFKRMFVLLSIYSWLISFSNIVLLENPMGVDQVSKRGLWFTGFYCSNVSSVSVFVPCHFIYLGPGYSQWTNQCCKTLQYFWNSIISQEFPTLTTLGLCLSFAIQTLGIFS